ncbi:DUF5808 domain-containing protein [Halobellus salinisoli]|uniref:DUF5808 domain-containing protein n=1 Tax=Halobellus salinisoli TaxID=3108500 RepID=UPI003009B745
MVDKPKQGEILGIPYNFERPSIGRMLASYWKPGEKMLVKKPFGIGYTLNLANWRSWVALAVVGGLLWQEQKSRSGEDVEADDGDDGPVEVIVD